MIKKLILILVISYKFNILIIAQEEIEQSALLFIDVNLGNGIKPRITLYNGD